MGAARRYLRRRKARLSLLRPAPPADRCGHGGARRRHAAAARRGKPAAAHTGTGNYLECDRRHTGRRVAGEGGRGDRLCAAYPATPRHQARYLLDCLRPLHVPQVLLPVPRPAQEAPRELAGTLLESGGRPVVLLHAGTGAHWKRWPLGGFIELAALLQDAGIAVRWSCGPDEPSLSDELRMAGVDLPATLWPQLDLEDFSSLLARCDLVVSADCGVAHLAALCGVPQVTLFGPTDSAPLETVQPAGTRGAGAAALCRRVGGLRHSAASGPCEAPLRPAGRSALPLPRSSPGAGSVRGMRGDAGAMTATNPAVRPETVLLWQVGALGDTLLAYPAMAALRAWAPSARISMVGRPAFLRWALRAGLIDAAVDPDSAIGGSLAAGKGPGPHRMPDLAMIWSADGARVAAHIAQYGAGTVLHAPARPAIPLHQARYLVSCLQPLGVPRTVHAVHMPAPEAGHAETAICPTGGHALSSAGCRRAPGTAAPRSRVSLETMAARSLSATGGTIAGRRHDGAMELRAGRR